MPDSTLPSYVIHTYRIPEQNLDRFEKGLNKLNRRAIRLGCPEIQITTEGSELEPYTHDGVQGFNRIYLVKVVAQEIIVNGWTFLGVLQHFSEGTIVRNTPGQQIPSFYWDVEPFCDHCQTNRKRNDTFILYKYDEHVYQQVGRNCLADFLGRDVHAFSRYCEILSLMNELGRGCSERNTDGSINYWDLESYLAQVVEVIDRIGWISKSESRRRLEEEGIMVTSSADIAANLYFRPDSSYIPTDSQRKRASEAIEWASNLDEEEIARQGNDYLHNLKVVCSSGACERRTAGIAASVIMAHTRATQVHLDFSNSQHVGVVGERSDFVLTVNTLVAMPTGFGDSYLHKFSDPDGNMVVWWSSREKLELHKTYRLKGTVKSHDSYRGVNQTVLTRCKVLESL